VASVFELSEPYRNFLVSVLPLGRHFDRDFGTGETYYREAKARRFTWDTCCLEADQPHDNSST
jgi:hypothetical protein